MKTKRCFAISATNLGSILFDLPHGTAVPWLVLMMFLPPALAAAGPLAASPSAIPRDQIRAIVEKQYSGDGLSVCIAPGGARLRCVFQKMEGEVTRDGLWLMATAENPKSERFRVVATSVGRAESESAGHPLTPSLSPTGGEGARTAGAGTLPRTGTVEVAGNVARFIRPGLAEEYRVSVDGVQQDFVIAQRPGGQGQLRVELDVVGARAEPLTNGARLVLEGSGRKLHYHRLQVTDTTGKELPARMEVLGTTGDSPDEIAAAIDCPAVSWVWSGSPGSPVRRQALAVLVDDTEAVYPVRIDPTFSDADWLSLGGIGGPNGVVFAAVVDGTGNLYIGGDFTAIGEGYANNIARWNGRVWSALGSGLNGGVRALAVSGSDLYAGGRFTTAGGVNVNYIAKWNGSAWSALGSGMSGNVDEDRSVYALAVSGGDLYAGGAFITAGEVSANRIAKWDGSAWSALDSGMNEDVYALAASGSGLYAGGYFTNAGGVSASRIARWNGNAWSTLGSGMDSSVFELAVSGSDLYAGGHFTVAGGVSANRIAKWNGKAWSAFGSGMNGIVHALAVSGSDLYAGGRFSTAGEVGANYIAKWNGSAWSALGSGVNGAVLALAVSGTNVYAGGGFTTAGGIPVNHMAKWDGGEWTALGSGMNGGVFALTVSDSGLYAGGAFTTAGGVSATNIAIWNGSAWSALGSGITSPPNFPYLGGVVWALAASGSDLYAGGDFTTAGETSALRIAKWNGSAWSALGSGINGSPLPIGPLPYVSALAVSGSDLYAGGYFTTAGGVRVNYIAKWNGSAWSALGLGTRGPVNSLAVSGTDLYAGGYFSTAGEVSANNIAKWDGITWSAVGSGVSGPVAALTAAGSDLYAGGTFTTAGGKLSGYAARAYIGIRPPLSIIRSGANVTLSWPSAGSAGFMLEQTPAVPNTAAWNPNGALVTDDMTNKSVSLPATKSPQYFRLRKP